MIRRVGQVVQVNEPPAAFLLYAYAGKSASHCRFQYLVGTFAIDGEVRRAAGGVRTIRAGGGYFGVSLWAAISRCDDERDARLVSELIDLLHKHMVDEVLAATLAREVGDFEISQH
jgi:hypothetical protein